MNLQTLKVTGVDLDTNKPFTMKITVSNRFMLAFKYATTVMRKNIWVSDWQILSGQRHSGSKHPINAGAYLHEMIEEITGEKF